MKYGTLISTGALEEHLLDLNWVVIDCRHDLMNPEAGRRAYEASHIPGARFLHLDRDLAGPKTGANGRHPLPDPEVFAATLGAAGINAGKQVVAYDAQEGMNAARLWWMLRWVGHSAVAVLDGGWPAWAGESRPSTEAVLAPEPATFSPKPGAGWVDAQHLFSRLGAPDLMILDARSPARFRGEAEPIDPVAGRIPGSENRFFQSNLGPGGRFKPAEQLRSEFSALLGARSPEQVVHACGSGVSACHNMLAMEIAGLSGSLLYPGSWSEWCADPGRPIARG